MFTIERKGYSQVKDMTLDIIDDLIANGFSVKYPIQPGGTYDKPTTDTYRVILETNSIQSNIFQTTQPWRICFEIIDTVNSINISTQGGGTTYPPLGGPYLMNCFVGTSVNLRDDGSIGRPTSLKQPILEQPSPSILYKLVKDTPVGCIGAPWTAYTQTGIVDATPNYTNKSQCFVNRFLFENDDMGGFNPLSYRISITNRGLFIGTWNNTTQETGNLFNWLLVQRSVDKDTGKIRGTTAATVDSKCPVFCVNTVNNVVFKFVVRETDVAGPSLVKYNVDDVEDSPAPLNTKQQVSFNEDGNYVISLLNNLTTPRYKYPDELDMVGTISADVVGDGQVLDIKLYGEPQARKYIGLQANGANNTGMRLMLLIDNPNE